MNLSTDTEGNFYFVKEQPPSCHSATSWLPCACQQGWRKARNCATGYRAPNGMSVGPKGELTTLDNEGNWVPASRVNFVKPGGLWARAYSTP